VKPPHVTAWSGEVGYVVRPDPIIGGRPAVFAASGKPGDGAPVWGRISEERQRRSCVLRHCQVCDAMVVGYGYALVLTHEETLDGLVLTEPMVCRPCLPMALRCPAVRDAISTDGLIALQVGHYEIGFQILGTTPAPESEADRLLNAALAAAGLRRCVGFCTLVGLKARRLNLADLAKLAWVTIAGANPP